MLHELHDEGQLDKSRTCSAAGSARLSHYRTKGDVTLLNYSFELAACKTLESEDKELQ